MAFSSPISLECNNIVPSSSFPSKPIPFFPRIEVGSILLGTIPFPGYGSNVTLSTPKSPASLIPLYLISIVDSAIVSMTALNYSVPYNDRQTKMPKEAMFPLRGERVPEGEAVALAWIASATADPTIPASNVLLSLDEE